MTPCGASSSRRHWFVERMVVCMAVVSGLSGLFFCRSRSCRSIRRFWRHSAGYPETAWRSTATTTKQFRCGATGSPGCKLPTFIKVFPTLLHTVAGLLGFHGSCICPETRKHVLQGNTTFTQRPIFNKVKLGMLSVHGHRPRVSICKPKSPRAPLRCNNVATRRPETHHANVKTTEPLHLSNGPTSQAWWLHKTQVAECKVHGRSYNAFVGGVWRPPLGF